MVRVVLIWGEGEGSGFVCGVRRGERSWMVEATRVERVGRKFSGRWWGVLERMVEMDFSRWVWRWNAGGG